MTKPSAICIYCGEVFDPTAGQGDHVIPLAFGDFDNAIIFRGACPACNNKLSPFEEELLRTGPEAVFRWFVGAKSRQGKPVGWQAASGVPAPRFVIKHDDHEELVYADASTGGQAFPVDQLIALLKDGRSVTIKLFPSMSAQALRRKLQEHEVEDGNIENIRWKASEATTEGYLSLIKEIYPEAQHEELPSTSPGVHRVLLRIECHFTTKYYRAIAKIAFHYFLAQSRCQFTGQEACFEPIRSFIMTGGPHEPFFEPQSSEIGLPFGTLPDGSVAMPPRWMHALCCVESSTSVEVGVYLLFGPERPPSPHFVRLLHRPAALLVPVHRYGHVYIYGDRTLGDTREAFVDVLEVVPNH
jgi:hypothetical protein